MKVVLTARINPSEDPDKVKRAVLNLTDPRDSLVVQITKDEVRIEGGELTVRRIIQAVKDKDMTVLMLSLLNEGKKNDKYYLMFNKQAAFVGHLVMCDDPQESPLGPITVEFDTEAIKLILSEVKIARDRRSRTPAEQEQQF